MRVTIHQPEHLIWLGLVDKISRADTFVILDTVQFEKNYFQNRNKIRTPQGWMWLTVPIAKHPLKTKIKDVRISYAEEWQKRYLRSLEVNYGKAKYFSDYFYVIKDAIMHKYEYIADLNFELIKFVLASFGLGEKRIIKSSEMKLSDTIVGSELCLEICKHLGADEYLAGPSGRDYLKLDDFERNNIKVSFHDFRHPEYRQLFEPFIPGMSSVDLLFNYGPASKDILL